MISHQSIPITSANANTKVVVMKKGGILHNINILTTSAQALTLYDDNSTSPASAAQFGAIKASVAEQTFRFKLALNKGLVVNVPSSYTGSAVIEYSELIGS